MQENEELNIKTERVTNLSGVDEKEI